MMRWVSWAWTEPSCCYRTGFIGLGCLRMCVNTLEPAIGVNISKIEEIEQTEAQYSLEMVHVDFLMIGGKKDPRKDINILVVTDHFTRYAQAYVTTSQTTVTVARVLFTQFFTQYGWPTKLITNQGPQFEV